MDFEPWWQFYRSLNDLHHKKPGIRGKAESAWNKCKEDKQRLYDNTVELARYDRKCLSSGEKVDRWPHASTFINQGYFDREIGSYLEVEQKRQAKFCQCGSETIGPKYSTCAKCLPTDDPLRGRLREKYREMGLVGASKSEIRAKALKYIKELTQ